MQKLIFTLFVLAGMAIQLPAQTFFPLLGAVLEQEVLPNLANECYIHFEDDVNTDSLHLKWRLADATIPQGWDISLCDYGTCYSNIPPGKTMLPAYDTIQPYLKLVVLPNAEAGAAWIWFRVSRVGDDTDFQDVYFEVHTPGFVRIKIWPNPVSDILYVQQNLGTRLNTYPTTICASTGQIMWTGKLDELSEINIKNWSSGMYILKSPFFTKTFIVKN
jgi:hypothetical protein